MVEFIEEFIIGYRLLHCEKRLIKKFLINNLMLRKFGDFGKMNLLIFKLHNLLFVNK